MKYFVLLVVLFLIPGVIASEYIGSLDLSNSPQISSEPASSSGSGSSGGGGSYYYSGGSSSGSSSLPGSIASAPVQNTVVQTPSVVQTPEISAEIQAPVQDNAPQTAGNALTGAQIVDIGSGDNKTVVLVLGAVIGSLITLLGVAILLRSK